MWGMWLAKIHASGPVLRFIRSGFGAKDDVNISIYTIQYVYIYISYPYE